MMTIYEAYQKGLKNGQHFVINKPCKGKPYKGLWPSDPGMFFKKAKEEWDNLGKFNPPTKEQANDSNRQND